ncbi:MAG: diaminopimelate epimerase [Planctomycetota bacterium]|jgi:diaminopimelate epimerase
MKVLPFVKMEGAGNDYVFVDGINQDFDLEEGPRLAKIVADRHFGVGGDGLIVLAASEKADCRMVTWNADGSRAPMCGNGLRCLAKLAHDVGAVHEKSMQVETDTGVRAVELTFDPAGAVTGAAVDMGDVTVSAEPETVTIDGVDWHFHSGDAGNLHAVIFLDQDPDEAPVAEVGAAFQRLSRFPQGVNVEFVLARPDGGLEQRTHERGSGETLACGSGATVAALAAIVSGRVPGPKVAVHLRGGVLTIHRQASSLVMEGPARTVFAGEFLIPEQ